ncbi:sugar-binding domain-containing protein [Aggregatibacter actinomycetemcomitans]|uniref:sugar-binding domain-containing protein n=1 Tax=Aggregatibacter actinomycetemcomitans TaxID=714 RepID=UPI00023FEEAB|nr:sugar-binding domain-containing protein [Aggregatibacter actinomycetemcomitans]EHK91423.1 LacZ protein [Aggregatibacter actinomycetemcomitans RhAA1]
MTLLNYFQDLDYTSTPHHAYFILYANHQSAVENPKEFYDYFMVLNGQFVGYSKISHCTSEFSVMNYLQLGENSRTIIVPKWCDDSYLKEQDKFRMSGIFRDVYPLERDVQYLQDFSLKRNRGRISVKRKFRRNVAFPMVRRMKFSDNYLTRAFGGGKLLFGV